MAMVPNGSPRRARVPVLLPLALGAWALSPCLAFRSKQQASLADNGEEGGQVIPVLVLGGINIVSSLMSASTAVDQIMFKKTFSYRRQRELANEHIAALSQTGDCTGMDCPVDSLLALKATDTMFQRAAEMCRKELKGQWFHNVGKTASKKFDRVFGIKAKMIEPVDQDAVEFKKAVNTLHSESNKFNLFLKDFEKTTLCPGLREGFDEHLAAGNKAALKYEAVTGKSLYLALVLKEDRKWTSDTMGGLFHKSMMDNKCFELHKGTKQKQRWTQSVFPAGINSTKHMADADAHFRAAAVLLQEKGTACARKKLKAASTEVGKCVPYLYQVLIREEVILKGQRAAERLATSEVVSNVLGPVQVLMKRAEQALAFMGDMSSVRNLLITSVGTTSFLSILTNIGRRVVDQVSVRESCVTAAADMSGLSD